MLTEKQYRANPADSYSTTKTFIEDRKKYYKKYVLGEYVEEKESASSMKGSICDLLLQPGINIEDYVQIAMNDIPTGQMLLFTEELYKITMECTTEDGSVTRSMQDLMEEALNNVKYDRNGVEVAFKKKDLDYVVKKFVGTNAEEYYEQLRQSSVKYIVSPSDLEDSERIVEGLKLAEQTSNIVNAVTNDEIEVFDQLQIFFDIEGHDFKGKLDRAIVDHKNKVIRPYDYKITWGVESFDERFRTMKYYLQTASYNIGIQSWAEQNGIGDYKKQPLAFVVADSINYFQPLIWETDEVLHNQGLYGYVDMFGRTHPGLLKALDDIQWHKQTGIWNISRDNYESRGILKLKSLA